MGVDIIGCVEVRKIVAYDYPPEWVGVCLIDKLVERNYGMFGAILDVRNSYGFPAPFAHRGFPEDESYVTGLQAGLLGGGWVKPSWALWSELDTLWDQIGPLEEELVISLDQWNLERENPLFVIESTIDTPAGVRIQRTRKDHPELGAETLFPYDQPRIGLCYVRQGHFAVRELISPGWQARFDVMAALANTYGADNVRLVAWCDSE